MLTMKWIEQSFDGSSVTYDYEARAGYVHVDPTPDAFAVARTVDIGGGVHVDLDADGRVRGVETMHEPHLTDLIRVLRWCSFTEGQHS